MSEQIYVMTDTDGRSIHVPLICFDCAAEELGLTTDELLELVEALELDTIPCSTCEAPRLFAIDVRMLALEIGLDQLESLTSLKDYRAHVSLDPTYFERLTRDLDYITCLTRELRLELSAFRTDSSRPGS